MVIVCDGCSKILWADAPREIHAQVTCSICGHKNLVLTHDGGTLRYDGDKYGTLALGSDGFSEIGAVVK